MARGAVVELSDYERKRQETIAKNQALLRNLQLDAAEAGIAPTRKKAPTGARSAKRKPAPKIKEEDGPRRTSSRLKGIVADSEVAKRKAEDESVALQAAERAKRQRISGDLNLSDILVSGKSWDQSGNFLTGVGPARPNERTFSATDVKTGDKELRALREKMSNLELWEGVSPSRIKITPERVYSMAFHPNAEKALVFAGDKLGNLGIFDGSQGTQGIKSEDDEEEDEWEPSITTLKPHSRTISAMHFHGDALYMASYDSAIRKLDLEKGVAVEVYAPQDSREDEPLSGVQIPEQEPHMLYFSTLSGMVGRHDMRTSTTTKNTTELFQLSEKKIGGFTLNPSSPHFIATASLDRTMRIWDLRKLTKSDGEKVPALVGEHESRLSVSHAAWNYAGQVATSSYDDTVKIYDFGGCGDWSVGKELGEGEMKPKTVVPHNNQTGRWVTSKSILTPYIPWNQDADGLSCSSPTAMAASPLRRRPALLHRQYESFC
jgi:WD40 repeat protein